MDNHLLNAGWYDIIVWLPPVGRTKRRYSGSSLQSDRYGRANGYPFYYTTAYGHTFAYTNQHTDANPNSGTNRDSD